MGKNFGLISFKYDVSSWFSLHLLLNYYFSLLNVYLMQNWNPIEIPASLFFHNIGHNLAHILPLKPHPLYFYLNDF